MVADNSCFSIVGSMVTNRYYDGKDEERTIDFRQEDLILDDIEGTNSNNRRKD